MSPERAVSPAVRSDLPEPVPELPRGHGIEPRASVPFVIPQRERLRLRYRALIESHEELLRQMRLAEQVQRSLPPRPLPSTPGVTFAAALRPTLHMAGDFYSVFRLDATHVGFYVGDVMGHGPAAALLSVYAMLSLKTKNIEGNSYEILPPATALEQLSRALIAADLPGQPFITMIYGVLDTAEHTWTYCSGGHPHPFILRAGKPICPLEVTGPLLGAVELPFRQASVRLEPGDRLVLYSDGAAIALWGDRGAGLDGLASWLDQRDTRSAQDILDDALANVTFDHPQEADDIAVLVAEL